LIGELRIALAALAAEPVAPPPPTAVVSAAETGDASARLNELLCALDPAAVDCLESNAAALRPLFGDRGWPAFEKLVQGYAFADAQVRLEEALESCRAATPEVRVT
jgi:hypothetical protein